MNRRVLTAGSTFLLALAAGHFMQNGRAVAGYLGKGSEPVASVSADAAQVTIVEGSVTELSADTELPMADASLPAIPELPSAEGNTLTGGNALAARMVKVERGYSRAKSAADADYNAFGLTCADAALSLMPAPFGLVDVRLAAPCHANERVTLALGGLTVTYATDAEGGLSVTVPALDQDMRVSAGFAAGDGAEAILTVPEATAITRIAIGWTGTAGFGLNAYENGAAFGSAGHIRAEAPGAPGAADRGYMMLLGDAGVADPLLALVYTAPSDGSDARLEVEAQVTAATCARPLSGTAVTLAGGTHSVSDVSLAMPGCDALGDLVVMDVTSALRAPVAQASN
jgi:hypothetical protein